MDNEGSLPAHRNALFIASLRSTFFDLFPDPASREKRIKAEALMCADKVVWEAWQWLRANVWRFEKRILGPLCLELSVQDSESA